MANSFTAKLRILPASQRQLWGELNEVPPDFVLYGGTAIALHLGHRNSVDFDFFTRQPFDPDELLTELRILNGCHVLQKQKNTLTVIVDRGGPVNISFLGVPRLGQISEPLLTDDNQLKVASLIDLAATKAGVVQKRAEAKDYIDLDAMIIHAQISLSQALAAAAAIYGPQYNPELTLKSLCYYEDGNLPSVPKETRNRLVNSVNDVDLANLPIIKAIIPWSG